MPTTYYGVTSAGQVRPSDGTASIKGYRAYFTGVSAPAGGRLAIMIDDEDISTGLSAMKWLEGTNEVYNLQGQRVENTGKGIYIVNGRKVIVK